MPRRLILFAMCFLTFLSSCLASPSIVQDEANQTEAKTDWKQWGGTNSRMNTPLGRNIPTDWKIGEAIVGTGSELKQGRQPVGSQNIKWAAKLGSETRGNPVVAEGKVFIGTNNGAGYLERYPPNVDLGVLLCFEEATGNFLWQHSNQKLKTGREHDWNMQGVCSTPVVDDNRLWYVSNRGEVICLDTEGFYDAEDDGIQHESTQVFDQEDADVVWRFDMMKELGVLQHNMATCSMLTADGQLFVCTSNGVDESHLNIPAPLAPSFMALDCETGRVVWTDNSPGANILHGQWASPSYGVFDNVAQVIFPGGDGWLYSFDPRGDGTGGSRLLWKFDGNPKASLYQAGGWPNDLPRSPYVAFPAIHEGLVYIALGEDPEHGAWQGRLWCIDPAKHTDGSDVSAELAVGADGKILPPRRLQAIDIQLGESAIPNPKSSVVWHYSQHDQNGDGEFASDREMFLRSLSTPVIQDDVLYIADSAGFFHCLNAKTGQVYWVYDLFSSCWGSPMLVENKVYIGDQDGKVTIFRHDANPRFEQLPFPNGFSQHEAWKADGTLINECECTSTINTTPIVANNVLYIATQTTLYAIQEPDSR